MRNLKYLLIAGAILMFAACSNDSGGGSSSISYSVPEGQTSYTIPADAEYINFPSEMNGKKCFVIYSNEQALSQLNTMDNAIIENQNESRSVDNGPEMIINKGAVDLGNGLLRDEVRIEVNYPLIPDNSRAASSTPKYNQFLINDNLTAESDATSQNPVSKVNFYIPINNNSSESHEFTLKTNGNHCRVWFWNHKPSLISTTYLTQNEFNTLAQKFDEYYEKEIQIFGSHIYNYYSNTITATNDTKIEILVYDLFKDAVANQNSGTFGLFNGNDFIIDPQTSNECQNIHIDSYFLQSDIIGYTDDNNQKVRTHNIESTMVHEFQHLLNFCNKKGDGYKDWFTEMLSMSAEDVFNIDHPKSRFNVYFDRPYQGFGNWPNSGALYAYSNAYAFGAYLMRNYGGIRLIHEIATNAYVDEQAITEALKTLGYNESFSSVFKKFGSVYVNTDSGNLYSLNREISDKFAGIDYNLIPINLNDFYMAQFPNYSSFAYETKTNLYCPSGRYAYDSDGNYYLMGPRIFKSSYLMLEPIQKYGFVVYYAGEIASGKSLKVKHKSNLDMTVVVK